MKRNLFFYVLLFCTSTAIFAQMRVVALHSPTNGVQYFSETQSNFQPLQNAYTAAVDGDTLYISGGDFAPPALFNKRLTVYGAGHYPSATTETQKTTITGNLSLGDLADNSHFEGMSITSSIIINDINTHSVTIKRCIIEGGIDAGSTSGNFSNNCVFAENIFKGSLNINNLRAAQFYNNFIFGILSNAVNAVFVNNNFLAYSTGYWNDGWVINYANSCVLNNNIFARNNSLICSNGTNVWNNNIFHIEPSLGLNPIVSASVIMVPTDVFVSYTSNSNFSYTQDYHLTATALTHLGNDGTQRGVYGGAASFKAESIPVNPHISSAVISPESTAGQINVNIQVQAQSR